MYSAIHANQLMEGSQDERSQRANYYYAIEVNNMPGWGAWWSGDGCLIDSPQDSIQARIRPPQAKKPKVDPRVLTRGWDLMGYMTKMCHAFEIIRKKGPGGVAAGPYKNRPDFGADAHYTYHDGPTGETEEEWWVDCEDEAFEEPIHKLGDAPVELRWAWRLACPDSPFYKDVDLLKVALTKANPAGQVGADVKGLHAFIRLRENKNFLIDPRLRAPWRGWGASRKVHRAVHNLAASIGTDHRVPQNTMLQMTPQVQARATERAAQLGAMVTSADNLRLELEI